MVVRPHQDSRQIEQKRLQRGLGRSKVNSKYKEPEVGMECLWEESKAKSWNRVLLRNVKDKCQPRITWGRGFRDYSTL